MAFLFRNKQKTNAELTRSTRDLAVRLSQEDKPNPKVRVYPAVTELSMLTGYSWKRSWLETCSR